ncbi:MAG TPA: TRAM domain-containing protein, partial [Thermoplasmata archaeon]|nr:TRAM domain-containing protein [Thermoplasmata archaeon]
LVSAMNRPEEQVLGFLLKELGTAGQLKEGGRIVFKGKISRRKIKERIDEYINDYVLCHECGRPDTRVEREGRITLLRCEACGAHRPLKVVKTAKTEAGPERVIVGKRYEVKIIDIGREGDGIARIGDTIVYVPETAKGDIVTIEITLVKPHFAIGKKV